MNELGKVNSVRLYRLWKNLTVGLVTIIAVIAFSKMLPYYLSPVVSLIAAAFLYTYIYEARVKQDLSCMIVNYGMLYSLVLFSFTVILLNVLYAWGMTIIPREFIFFNHPFIPSLLMNPVCFVTFLFMTMRRRTLHICVECKLHGGGSFENSAVHRIFQHEAHFQLRNLSVLFGILTVLVWVYYLVFYVNINVNDRDWYMFSWVTIICVAIDVVYFIARYYNLYLDLKENNEIIRPEELSNISAKTYLRFYVVCGNNLYVDTHVIDPLTPYKELIDTPFVTKRPVNGIGVDEVKRIIKRMTGYDGELRFFFGRKSADFNNVSILRYFYFLDGDIADYPELNTEGEWIDFEKMKYFYSNNPGRLSDIAVADTTRLATIMLTEKTFDDRGYRKSRIKFYNPTFNLIDVKKSNLDFQDDKWIKISLFNSDTPFYSFKRKWRQLFSKNRNSNSWR